MSKLLPPKVKYGILLLFEWAPHSLLFIWYTTIMLLTIPPKAPAVEPRLPNTPEKWIPWLNKRTFVAVSSQEKQYMWYKVSWNVTHHIILLDNSNSFIVHSVIWFLRQSLSTSPISGFRTRRCACESHIRKFENSYKKRFTEYVRVHIYKANVSSTW